MCQIVGNAESMRKMPDMTFIEFGIPSNGVNANVVLRNLDLFFQKKNFNVNISEMVIANAKCVLGR